MPDERERELLTKDKLLKGKAYTERVYFEKLHGELELRGLTEAEFTTIERRALKAIKARGSASQKNTSGDIQFEMSFADIMTADREVAMMVAACGLSVGGQKWTVDEVGRLPFGIVEDIKLNVLRISNISEEDLDFFRTVGGGPTTGGDDSNGPSVDPQ